MEINNLLTKILLPAHLVQLKDTIETLTTQYIAQLPDGWCAMIRINELYAHEVRQTVFSMDYQEKNGGIYAEAKLKTLEQCPDLAYTGEEDALKLAKTLVNLFAPDPTISRLSKTISEAGKTSYVKPDIWETLRKKYRFTHWYGGLRIPMESFIFQSDSLGNCTVDNQGYEILIAFSGAKQWMDVYFALCIFQCLQLCIQSYWSNRSISYDMSKLKQDPTVKTFITMLDIK